MEPFCGPRNFCYYAFPTKKARLVLYFEKPFLENGFRSRHLFLFYFKRQNKIRKKTLNVTPDKKNASLGKSESRFGGQVTYWEGAIASRSTPLSP